MSLFILSQIVQILLFYVLTCLYRYSYYTRNKAFVVHFEDYVLTSHLYNVTSVVSGSVHAIIYSHT